MTDRESSTPILSYLQKGLMEWFVIFAHPDHIRISMFPHIAWGAKKSFEFSMILKHDLSYS